MSEQNLNSEGMTIDEMFESFQAYKAAEGPDSSSQPWYEYDYSELANIARAVDNVLILFKVQQQATERKLQEIQEFISAMVRAQQDLARYTQQLIEFSRNRDQIAKDVKTHANSVRSANPIADAIQLSVKQSVLYAETAISLNGKRRHGFSETLAYLVEHSEAGTTAQQLADKVNSNHPTYRRIMVELNTVED